MPSTETAAMADAPVTLELDADRVDRFRRRMQNPLMSGAFMLAKMPLGWFAGLRIRSVDVDRCETTVPYGWRTTNPFRSIYFAAHAMAAELSTGALAMLAVELAPGSVAMLLTGLEAGFTKKADSKVTFTCEEGGRIFAAVRQTVETGEPAIASVETVGRMADGTEVSRFAVTWSFKKRSSR